MLLATFRLTTRPALVWKSTLWNPSVTITGNGAGKAFDGADTVAYTLTFTEGVQKIIAEDDLQVDGADIVSVLHEAGDTTATVTVKVDQDSLDNVSITAKTRH